MQMKSTAFTPTRRTGEFLSERQDDTPKRAPREAPRQATSQTIFFTADTAYAFTTVLAGFAFTTTSLPNIIRLPAFVAGFSLVLILHSPWTVNTPLPLTSFVPMSARAASNLEQTVFLRSCCAANAAARPPFDIGAPLFLAIAFIAFIAFIALIAFIAFMAFMAFIAFIALIGSMVVQRSGFPRWRAVLVSRSWPM